MLMPSVKLPSVVRRHSSRSLGLVVLLAANSVHAESLRLPSTFSFDAFDRERDANAQEKATNRFDGVYGRFDGKLSLEPFVGATFTQAGLLTEFGVAAYYFHTVGLQAKYADGRLYPFPGDAPFSVSTVSLNLRPLFLWRWSKDLEQGPSWLDLTIDSLTLKVGGYWAAERHSPNSKRGLETELALGFPLLAKYAGPWLSLAVAHRYQSVTNDGHAVDLAACLRLEWAFSLEQ